MNLSDTDNDEVGATLSEKPQHAQPVVSLLEKYSSLHRGIDEARKVCSQRQLEIDSVEEEIRRLVDVERIAVREAIQMAISEKEALLQTLETLTLNDLVEAQEEEFLAQSHHESVRSREEQALRIEQDDQNEFLNSSKTFREKIRTLCLRGELYGLKTPVTLLSVYKTLHGSLSSETKQVANVESATNNDEEADEMNNEIPNFFLADANLLWGDDGTSCDDATSTSNDEEMQELLKQLQEQNKSNTRHQRGLDEAKAKHVHLLETKEKKAKQKKGLEAQWERLQKDARAMVLQIENLNEQTREAKESTNRFRSGK